MFLEKNKNKKVKTINLIPLFWENHKKRKNNNYINSFFFFFFYEWEHRTGTMCPFSSLHPLKKGKEV